MNSAILRFSGAFFRKNFALLISLAGHALVIWVVLMAWRAFQSHFSLSDENTEEKVFEIEIVSPEALKRIEEDNGGREQNPSPQSVEP